MNIPIVVIAYNRELSLKRLLKSLSVANYENKRVDLIISIDGNDNEKVNQVAEEFHWENGNKRLINHNQKLGLRKHVLKAGDIALDYDGIIMLEDDLLVSKSFYKYTIQAVENYQRDTDIAGISLYTYRITEFANYRTFIPMQDDSDVFFMKVPSSWGQIWTRNQWKLFRDWYNKEKFIDKDYSGIIPEVALNWKESSWKKYFYMYIAETSKYVVYPRVGLSTNMADVGTHHKTNSTAHQSILMNDFDRKYAFKKLSESISVYDAFFENEKIKQMLDLDENLIVDYYGIKNKFKKYTYMLSTRKLNYEIINQWSLSLKPYELNVIYDIKGSDLFLYNLKKVKRGNKINNKVNKIKYELPGITKEKSLVIVISDYISAIKRRVTGRE